VRFLLIAAGFVCVGAMLATPAGAQDARQDDAKQDETRPEGPPRDPGHILVLSKCFQCHTDAMYRDLRQDHRAWEATVYRMIGRGALWTPEEVRLMTDYLGSEYGPGGNSVTAPQ
jgi:hypothetical protein